MAKKCLVCGAPLDGFFAKIAALAGVKPSEKNPDYCNKCEVHIPESSISTPIEKPTEPKDLYEAAAEPKIETTTAAPQPSTTTEPTPPPAEPAPEPPKPAEPEIKLNTEEPADMFAATDKKE